MITEFRVAGWWRENEAAGAASALLSRLAAGDEFISPPWSIQVGAETSDGVVKVISDDDLSEEQIVALKKYFEGHPEQDMPQWERARLMGQKVRRGELVGLVRKVTESSEVSLPAADVRDALRALAEWAGVLERE